MSDKNKTWTCQEINDDVLKLHQQRSGYKPNVVDEVKAASAWFVETLSGKDYNLLPFEMNVMEYGEDRRVLGVYIYDGHLKLLIKIAHDLGDDLLSVEESDKDRFYKVKISTSNPHKIVDMIAKMKLKTTVKIKLQSKPEVRMVQKAVAYKRDTFDVQVVTASAYNKENKDGTTELRKRVRYSTEPMGEGTFARRLNMVGKKTRLQCENGGSRIFINGSDMFLILKMNVRTEEMLPFANEMLKGIYLIRSKGVRNGVSIGYEYADGEETKVMIFGDKSVVRNGKEVKDAKLTMENIEDGIAKGKVLKYKPFPQSPSMTRTQSVLMVNVTHNSMDEVIDMINKASYGAFKVMLAAYSGEPLRAEKAIKKISRLSLTMTGGAKFGTIKNFAFFMGDLEAFGSSFHDGQGFLAAETIQTWLAAKGVKVPLEECFKYSNQGRFGTVKGFNLSVPRWTINEVIDYLISSGIAKGKVYLKNTLEQAIDVEKNANGKYDGKILIYGDENELDYFGDSTNVKCMFDLSQEIEYSLMDLPVEPKGHIVTSRQVCNVAQAHPDFLPVFVALAMDTINHILKNGLGDTDVTTDSLEYEGETHMDISRSNFSADILTQLIPEIDKLDRTVRRIKYKGIIDALNRVANRFNFRVKGINCKIVGDLAGWFGARLLDKQEVFTITMKSSNGILKAIAMRHPLCGIGEHLPVAFVGVQELIDRLPNAKRENGTLMTQRQQEAVAIWIKYLMPGVAMLASTFAFVAAYFSGADFDGDMVSFFLEESLVELFLSMPLYYVLFGGHNTAKDKFNFDYELIAHSFRYQYAIGGGTVNPSIGMLAGYNVTVLGLLRLVMDDKVSPIWVRNQLRPVVNGVKQVIDTEVKGNYKRAYMGNVNFEGKEKTFIDDFLLAVSKAGNSKQEVVDILLDLNVIISKCMNDIIDAAKTGDKVEVPFMTLLEGRVRSGAVAVDDYGKIELMKGDSTELQPLQLSIGEMPKGIKESPFKVPFKYDENGVIVFQDLLVELRNEALKYGYQKVKEALTSSIDDPFGAYETCDADFKGVLDMFSSQFVDMMEGKMTDRKSAKIAIVNMARAIAKKYSSVKDSQLIFEARLASYYTNKKTKKLDSNSFYLAFTHEIATYFVNKYCPDKMFTSRIYKNGGGYGRIGQEITFEDGFSKDGFYCETPITGTYTLEVSNHGNAVVRRPVKDMIPEKTINKGVFVEIVNLSSIKGIPNRKADDIIDIVESARSGDSTFTFSYVNEKTGEVSKDYHGARMCILIDGQPKFKIRTPLSGSYFERFLYGKTLKVTQTELGSRNKTDIIYLLGDLE